jgi:hypothetical protein
LHVGNDALKKAIQPSSEQIFLEKRVILKRATYQYDSLLSWAIGHQVHLNIIACLSMYGQF